MDPITVVLPCFFCFCCWYLQINELSSQTERLGRELQEGRNKGSAEALEMISSLHKQLAEAQRERDDLARQLEDATSSSAAFLVGEATGGSGAAGYGGDDVTMNLGSALAAAAAGRRPKAGPQRVVSAILIW